MLPSTYHIKRRKKFSNNTAATKFCWSQQSLTLPSLFFYLLDFSVSLFSYEMSQHQKNENFYLFSILHTKSPLLSYEEGSCSSRIVESEKGSIVFLNEISLEKGLLYERMYPQKAMIRKFLGLKVICALTNWIATTMLMDFLLRIISSDMSLLKEVVRITITFNSHCPRAAFEKLRQRVDLKIFHGYIN